MRLFPLTLCCFFALLGCHQTTAANPVTKRPPLAVSADKIRVIDSTTWLSVHTSSVTLWKNDLPVHKAMFWCLPYCTLSSDGKTLYGQRNKLLIPTWKVEPYPVHHRGSLPPFTQNDSWHMAPDGKHALLEATVRRTDLRREGDGANFRRVVSLRGPRHFPVRTTGNMFSAWSSTRLAVTSEDRKRGKTVVMILSRKDFREQSRMDYAGYINSLLFAASGELLFAKTNRNDAIAWRLDGTKVASWRTTDQIWGWALHPAGKQIAFGVARLQAGVATVQIWTVEAKPRLLRSIEIHRRPEELQWDRRGVLWVGGVDTKGLHDDRVYRFANR